jgi:hypothetical protein
MHDSCMRFSSREFDLSMKLFGAAGGTDTAHMHAKPKALKHGSVYLS